MEWNELTSVNQIEALVTLSATKPVLIFKHSTRCSISATALNRFERHYKVGTIEPYFLDLLAYRDISDALAERFGVEHQSPQVLLISNGECIYTASHFEIDYADAIAATV